MSPILLQSGLSPKVILLLKVTRLSTHPGPSKSKSAIELSNTLMFEIVISVWSQAFSIIKMALYSLFNSSQLPLMYVCSTIYASEFSGLVSL